METLHQTMVATKAVEYVMAAGFLMLFAAFWLILHRPPSKR